MPSLSEMRDLHHDDAIHVANFGDLGLVEGAWPVIGGHDEIEAVRDWPTPIFGRLQNPPPKGWRVTYRDVDTNEPASIEPVSAEDCLALPNDVVSVHLSSSPDETDLELIEDALMWPRQ